MNFRSYYTKVIFSLVGIFLFLFILLGIVDGLIIKHTINGTLSVIQQRRMFAIFKELKKLQAHNADNARVQQFIDQLFMELQIDVYDNEGKWIAGNRLFRTPPPNIRQALALTKGQFSGYSVVFESPFKNSRYKYLTLNWTSEEKPILRKAFFLLTLSGMITIFVAVGVGWALASSLNKRLTILQNGVAEIERGNFNVQLNIKGHDEIAQLGKKFNRMARQLNDLIQQLEESNNARRRLVAHATHEMKSPITSIKGFVDIVDYLGLLKQNPQGHQLLEVVRKDIKRLVKITDDLVQLAKYQEAEFSLERSPIALIPFLKEEFQYFFYKALLNTAQVELILPQEKSLTILADPIRLSQVLDNIWSNALKYGDHTQPIITEVRHTNAKVTICVRNILPYDLDIEPEQLFEPFYRYPKVSDKVPGSGLGLSITKELVEKMGGKINIEYQEKQFVVSMHWETV